MEKSNNWISVKDSLPDDSQEVIITYVNNNPPSYYNNIKAKPMVGCAVFYNQKWYWYSSITTDILSEYGRYENEEIDKNIEIIAWQSLPKQYKSEAVK